MRRIRKFLLTTGVVLALLLPLGIVASADPGDGGGSCASCFTTSATFSSTSPSRGR